MLLTFAATYWFGKLARLPNHEPILIATRFSICGASAIGAMSGVVKAKDSEVALLGLGTGVRVRELVSAAWQSLLVGLGSRLFIAVLAYGAVLIS